MELTHEVYLQSHRRFILATVFRPAEAPTLAAPCLLPVADIFATARERQARSQPWLSVAAFVRQVAQTDPTSTLMYEVWVAELVLALRRRMAHWPRLWQEPVQVYLAEAYDVRLDDPQDLAALAREASAARQEALAGLYGEEVADAYDPAAWEVWAEEDAVSVEEEDTLSVEEEDTAEESWGYFLEEYAEYHLGSGEAPLPEAALRQAWQRRWHEEPWAQRERGGHDE